MNAYFTNKLFNKYRDQQLNIKLLTKSDIGKKIIKINTDCCGLITGNYDLSYTDIIYTLKDLIPETITEDDIPKFCSKCGKICPNGPKCGRCLNTRYCDKECQIKHWTKHKFHCKKPKNNILVFDENAKEEKIIKSRYEWGWIVVS
jgi:hypothetical protein